MKKQPSLDSIWFRNVEVVIFIWAISRTLFREAFVPIKKTQEYDFYLELPTELALVPPVFHISLLKKYISDSTSVIPLESVSVEDSLSYKEVLVEIIEH